MNYVCVWERDTVRVYVCVNICLYNAMFKTTTKTKLDAHMETHRVQNIYSLPLSSRHAFFHLFVCMNECARFSTQFFHFHVQSARCVCMRVCHKWFCVYKVQQYARIDWIGRRMCVHSFEMNELVCKQANERSCVSVCEQYFCTCVACVWVLLLWMHCYLFASISFSFSI